MGSSRNTNENRNITSTIRRRTSANKGTKSSYRTCGDNNNSNPDRDHNRRLTGIDMNDTSSRSSNRRDANRHDRNRNHT